MALTIHLIDELRVGGAQTHLVTLLRELVRRGCGQHEVWVLCEDGPVGQPIRDMGVNVRVMDLRADIVSRRYRRAVRVLVSALREVSPAVLEAHLTWSRLLGLYSARSAGIPLRIGFEHGDIYLNSLKFRAANFLSQFFCDRLVVCSQALADWNHRVNRIAHKKMAVLHNCVDTARFQPASA